MLKVYDFYCPSCNKTFEEFVDSSDVIAMSCPERGCGEWCKRVLSLPRVRWISMAGNNPGHFPTADD